MSKTYSLGVTNTTASEYPIVPVALSLATNYALRSEVPGEVVLANTTTPRSQEELIKFSCKRKDRIQTLVTSINPLKVKEGVVYSSEVHNLCRVTDSENPDDIVDAPFYIKLTIGHDISIPWTALTAGGGNSLVMTELKRLLGTIQSNEGVELFDKLARGALRPTED